MPVGSTERWADPDRTADSRDVRPGGNRAPRVTGVPIWLLDVDGVLNAVCHPSRPPRTWDSWRSGTAIAAGERFVITFAPELMTGIRDLHESGMVEIRWLTTWGHDANRSLRHLLELPEFPVAGEPAYAEAWWKLPCAVRAAQDERPLIWTDDDLDYSEPARAWAAKLDALTIAPEPTVGLTPADLDAIRTYCAKDRRQRG